MGQGCARACRASRRRARGRLKASASCRPRATKPSTATRTPTDRAPRATGSCRCAAGRRGPPDARGGCGRRWGVPLAQVKAQNHEVGHSQRQQARLRRACRRRRRSSRCRRGDAEAQGSEDFRYIGKDTRSSTASTSPPAWRSTASTPARGCSIAVVARSPVFGGTITSFDAAEAMKVPGVVKVVEIKPRRCPRRSSRSAASRRGRVHVGRDQGTQGAEDRVERRPRRHVRLRDYRASWKGRGEARQGRAHDGDVDKAMSAAAKTLEPTTTCRISPTRPWSRPAAARGRQDGARSGPGEPEAAATMSPSASTCRPRTSPQRDAAGRRLWPQVEGRLRRRGRAPRTRWTARP